MLVWFRIKRVVGATEAGSNFEPVIEQFDFILQIKVGTYGLALAKLVPLPIVVVVVPVVRLLLTLLL